MAVLSKIEQLPEETQRRIEDLCKQRKLRLDDIEDILRKELGDDAPSRSALGRKRLKIKQLADCMRKSDETVKMFADSLGNLDDDGQSRLNYRLLQEQVFRLNVAALSDGEDATLSVKDVRAMADSMCRLAASRKLDADRIVRIKAEAAKETAEKAATTVETALKVDAPGLSADTVAKIKRQVLGVAA